MKALGIYIIRETFFLTPATFFKVPLMWRIVKHQTIFLAKEY